MLAGYAKKEPPEVFCKIGVLKNFCKFHRKTPVLESLFNRACNFIKKRLQNRCFPVKFAKFLTTPTFLTLPLQLFAL